MRWNTITLNLALVLSLSFSASAGEFPDRMFLGEEHLANLQRVMEKTGSLKSAMDADLERYLGKDLLSNPNVSFLETEIPLASFRGDGAVKEPTRVIFAAVRAERPDSPLLRPAEVGRVLRKPQGQFGGVFESVTVLFTQGKGKNRLALTGSVEPRYIWAKVQGTPTYALDTADVASLRFSAKSLPSYIKTTGESWPWVTGLIRRALISVLQ